MKKTTPYSHMKIFHQYDILKKLENGERCAPLYVRIKPTNLCNHDCSYCHYKHQYLDLTEYRGTDLIPRDKMLEIIDSLHKIGTKAVTFSGGGEPLLYPYIDETMERVADAGMDLSVITNGSMLKGKTAGILSRAKWVRISIDSVEPDKYASIRGIKKESFHQLCDNIQAFSRIKSPDCELGINFVVGEDNYKEVYRVGELMRDLGVNHVKFAPLISNETESYHKPFKEEVIEQLQRMKRELQTDAFKIIDLYTNDFDNYEVFARTYEKCPIKEFVCVIAANSKVYYCHDKAYLSDGCIGDLNERTFEDLWFSDEVTQRFQNFNAKEQCRHHCVYDQRNELLNSFLEVDKNHINFI